MADPRLIACGFPHNDGARRADVAVVFQKMPRAFASGLFAAGEHKNDTRPLVELVAKRQGRCDDRRDA